jgi:hypothetical protein
LAPCAEAGAVNAAANAAHAVTKTSDFILSP